MSDKVQSQAVQGQQGKGGDNAPFNWAKLLPKSVDKENAMNSDSVNECWAKMYSMAGLRTADETKQAAFRMAVYIYLKKNGTSRVGNYAGSFTTSDGIKHSASVIPNACQKLKVRAFMRGNMEESYTFLKDSKAIQNDPIEAKKAESLGIPAESAFATADWFEDCPWFTPAETHAYNMSFKHALAKSKLANGGRALEEVEEQERDELVAVQGSGEQRSGFSGRRYDF